MIYKIIFAIYFTIVCSDAITIDKSNALFYQDVHNHFLVLKSGSTCYFWQMQGKDIGIFYVPSSQRQLEEHFITALTSDAPKTPYTPDKLTVSFVIVASCPSSNYKVQVPAYST